MSWTGEFNEYAPVSCTGIFSGDFWLSEDPIKWEDMNAMGTLRG